MVTCKNAKCIIHWQNITTLRPCSVSHNFYLWLQKKTILFRNFIQVMICTSCLFLMKSRYDKNLSLASLNIARGFAFELVAKVYF